jgi:hypothetical protein
VGHYQDLIVSFFDKVEHELMREASPPLSSKEEKNDVKNGFLTKYGAFCSHTKTQSTFP